MPRCRSPSRPASTAALRSTWPTATPPNILRLLGLIEVGSWGSVAADDFLGRVLLAQAMLGDDGGRDAVRAGNWIACGRSPGYLTDRLAELEEIATWALYRSVAVQWH